MNQFYDTTKGHVASANIVLVNELFIDIALL